MVRSRLPHRVLFLVASLFLLAGVPAAQVVGPSQEKMLQRVDPSIVRKLNEVNAALARNPRDVDALNMRGALEVKAALHNPYSFFWLYQAAKDLEQVLQKEPNNFFARHNYGQAAFLTGDVGTDQPNMRLAVIQFTKAIELNPRSARSFMGRGWAYQMLNDPARANADYQKALQLDPSLRADLVDEANGIDQKRAQLLGARQILERMGRYYVDRSVRTEEDCLYKYKGVWTAGECRISAALNPIR
jgi:tetratricopeptide (TPR) repeat protein